MGENFNLIWQFISIEKEHGNDCVCWYKLNKKLLKFSCIFLWTVFFPFVSLRCEMEETHWELLELILIRFWEWTWRNLLNYLYFRVDLKSVWKSFLWSSHSWASLTKPNELWFTSFRKIHKWSCESIKTKISFFVVFVSPTLLINYWHHHSELPKDYSITHEPLSVHIISLNLHS